MLKKYVIERRVPGIGGKSQMQLGDAARQSNMALAEIDGIQWQHSYVTGDQTYCIYLAENEDLIREHAMRSGFPANAITEVVTMFDPSTEKMASKAAKAA